jgi:hypothetical protein
MDSALAAMLERIGQQLKAKTVVSRAALDQGQFKA